MSQDNKPSIFFVANLMNFVLATGIFTLPFSLYESGLLLGSVVLCITCGLSIIACTFIIEALATQNALLKEEILILNTASFQRHVHERTSSLHGDNTIFEADNKVAHNSSKNSEKSELVSNEEEKDQFYIFKRYEISKLANKVFSKPVYFFVVIVMILYLYVGLTSNAMIAGKSLNSIITKTVGQEMPPYFYIIVVSCFYSLVIFIALNNINHLKKLSMFIMICRFIMIILILGSCIYSIIENGAAPFSEIPKFDLPHITVMIGNSLFLFMSHHSMPGMVENFKPQKRLIKLIIIAYICSLILMLVYGYISLLAFAHLKNCDFDVFPCAIQSTFSLNFLSLKIVGYIINYYPLLNIITSSLIAITLKNNILQVIGSCSVSLYKSFNFAEKSGCYSVIMSILFNFFLVLPSVAIAILLADIQQLMKYFSSILGFLIMLVVPAILVNGYRKKYEKANLPFGKLNRAFLDKNWHLIIIGILGLVIISLIIYGFINSDNKKCVAEPDKFYFSN